MFILAACGYGLGKSCLPSAFGSKPSNAEDSPLKDQSKSTYSTRVPMLLAFNSQNELGRMAAIVNSLGVQVEFITSSF